MSVIHLTRRKTASSILLPQVSGLFTKRSSISIKIHGNSLDSSSSPFLIHGIHVFECPDVVGIVVKLSDSIASRGGNILGADVFVSENKNVFYCRSEFMFDPVKWPRPQIHEDFLKMSKMFNAMKSVVRVPCVDPKFKIAILASKQVERVSHRDNLRSFVPKSENLERQCLAKAIRSYCELRFYAVASRSLVAGNNRSVSCVLRGAKNASTMSSVTCSRQEGYHCMYQISEKFMSLIKLGLHDDLRITIPSE